MRNCLDVELGGAQPPGRGGRGMHKYLDAGMSGIRDRMAGVTAPDLAQCPVVLVLGDQELLIERAVGQVITARREHLGEGVDLPITRIRAGDVDPGELAELVSPSLFAEDRVVVLESAAEAGKDAVNLILMAAQDPPEGVALVIVHSGGGRAKAMVPAVRKTGAVVLECAGPTKPAERVEFVRNEFRAAGVRVSGEVATLVLESVGSDLRELAAASSQLVADTGGKVNADAVRRYYAGRAEITGFDVAEPAVSGNRTGSLEALRWALLRGVPHVLIADALADAVHTIARVGSAGRGDPFALAPKLGMPPWKVKKAQAQARAWNPGTIAEALTVVAQLNADVKGQAAAPEYALERAVGRVCALAASS